MFDVQHAGGIVAGGIVTETRKRIVVIEDDVTIAGAVADRLRNEGFDVSVAYDGLDGLGICQGNQPDLVVLDLMLPGLDGLEVCRRLRAGSAVAILVLTARDDEADLLLSLESGADDYLTKPFSPRELVARIRAICDDPNSEPSTPPERAHPRRAD